MPTYKKKSDFFETLEGMEVEQSLRIMAADRAYCTEPSYSTNTTLYPNHLMPFVNKHMDYLRSHPATDPQHYLSNVRLMTRIKKVS